MYNVYISGRNVTINLVLLNLTAFSAPVWPLFGYREYSVLCNFAIISMRKRELLPLL